MKMGRSQYEAEKPAKSQGNGRRGAKGEAYRGRMHRAGKLNQDDLSLSTCGRYGGVTQHVTCRDTSQPRDSIGKPSRFICPSPSVPPSFDSGVFALQNPVSPYFTTLTAHPQGQSALPRLLPAPVQPLSTPPGSCHLISPRLFPSFPPLRSKAINGSLISPIHSALSYPTLIFYTSARPQLRRFHLDSWLTASIVINQSIVAFPPLVPALVLCAERVSVLVYTRTLKH